MNTWTCDRCGRLIQCHNHSLLDSFIDLHRCAQATPAAEAVEHLDRMARHKAPEKILSASAIWNNQTREVDHVQPVDYTRDWATKQNYDVLLLSEADSEMLKEMAIGI